MSLTIMVDSKLLTTALNRIGKLTDDISLP
jgi:hypothetical protein